MSVSAGLNTTPKIDFPNIIRTRTLLYIDDRLHEFVIFGNYFSVAYHKIWSATMPITELRYTSILKHRKYRIPIIPPVLNKYFTGTYQMNIYIEKVQLKKYILRKKNLLIHEKQYKNTKI